METYLNAWALKGGHWGWQVRCGRRSAMGIAETRAEAWRQAFILWAIFRCTNPMTPMVPRG